MNEQQQLDRIEAKLDRLISGPESPTIGIKDVMRLTGARSLSSAYRALKSLDVQPYAYGKYRRLDVMNAISRKALESRIVKPDPQKHIQFTTT